MINLPDVGPDGLLWGALLDIADRMSSGWTLVGGQMVFVLGLEHDTPPPRVSVDLDLVIDVRIRQAALSATAEALGDLGFSLEGVNPEGIGHRFVRDALAVDVLAPDGVGPRANLRTVGNARSIEVSGGSYALRRSRSLDARWSDRRGSIRLPDLAGALVIKAGAVGTDRLGSGERHLTDLAFLASLVPDPIDLRGELGSTNRSRLRRIARLQDRSDALWASLDPASADRGFTAWMLMIRP